jgi:hypothetical protein
MRPASLKQVQKTMDLLTTRLNSLIQAQLRRGVPVSYGTFTRPTPNTMAGRTPIPFTGGN